MKVQKEIKKNEVNKFKPRLEISTEVGKFSTNLKRYFEVGRLYFSWKIQLKFQISTEVGKFSPEFLSRKGRL